MTRVVIAHDYLGQFGGAEKVVIELSNTFPDAPIFASYYRPESTFAEFKGKGIHTSFLDHAPGIRRWYRAYMPLYPLAFRIAHLSDCDVVLSSSSAFAKGIRVPGAALHVCYCHAPMRFAWNMDAYLEHGSRMSGIKCAVLRPAMALMRAWDVRTNADVDVFVGNSENVAGRILSLYGRHAEVVYPPVEIDRFHPSGEAPDDFYLVVSRLVGYKRVDLAVEACTRLGRRLIVAGDGHDRARLEAMAGPTVQFLGTVGWRTVPELMSRCRALLFCGDEDFGITPVEAMASGRPVIAYGRGGALETVVDGETGLFFGEPVAEALMDAIQRFECRSAFSADVCRRRSERFDSERFRVEIRAVIDDALQRRNVSAL